jgi:hypothetical protein
MIKFLKVANSWWMLRDCRITPKMATLSISHFMKSITYKHQDHRFRIFRQSLEVPQVLELQRRLGYIAVKNKFHD